MYITASELSNLPVNVTMRIRSSGCFVYSVEFLWNNEHRLYSDNGREARIFKNLTSIKDCFRELPIEYAEMVHASAYDEMVGQPASEGNELSVPINIKTLY